MRVVRCHAAGKIKKRTFEIFYSRGTEYEKKAAILLDQDIEQVKGFKFLILKNAGKLLYFHLNIIQTSPLTSTSSDEDLEIFHEDQEQANAESRQQDHILLLAILMQN